ncbi:MAG: glycine cleavage T C-terminal barrel domain-containing protein [Pyrinomonadaceae bacterium]
MNTELRKTYDHIRSGDAGFYEQKRGLIAVWGKEAVQFLDGLLTNDTKTIADGGQMLAAFPNAQGRLLAVVRVMRQGDRFLFDTEGATHEKVFQNLFRFTFAGDFFVEDLSENYKYFEIFGNGSEPGAPVSNRTGFRYASAVSTGRFIENESADSFRGEMTSSGFVEISADLYETLRIESGVPKYGVDMDETTIVSELGIDGLISYNKGCYIGQEIIARIHFRGHVAKRLTGLILSEPGAVATGFSAGAELATVDGKNAGRITSVAFSPRLEKTIALAFVRYDYLANGTQLLLGDTITTVSDLPFIN